MKAYVHILNAKTADEQAIVVAGDGEHVYHFICEDHFTAASLSIALQNVTRIEVHEQP